MEFVGSYTRNHQFKCHHACLYGADTHIQSTTQPSIVDRRTNQYVIPAPLIEASAAADVVRVSVCRSTKRIDLQALNNIRPEQPILWRLISIKLSQLWLTSVVEAQRRPCTRPL